VAWREVNTHIHTHIYVKNILELAWCALKEVITPTHPHPPTHPHTHTTLCGLLDVPKKKLLNTHTRTRAARTRAHKHTTFCGLLDVPKKKLLNTHTHTTFCGLLDVPKKKLLNTHTHTHILPFVACLMCPKRRFVSKKGPR
jgi:hypothetical protein